MPPLRSDPYAAQGNIGQIGPAKKLLAVTIAASPDQDYVLPGGVCKSLWINDASGGSIGIIAEDDAAAVVIKVSGPGLIPIRCYGLRSGLTTVTDIVALY